MTRAEQIRMTKLEAENAELRRKLAKQLEIYRDQAWELVALRTALAVVRGAVNTDELRQSLGD